MRRSFCASGNQKSHRRPPKPGTWNHERLKDIWPSGQPPQARTETFTRRGAGDSFPSPLVFVSRVFDTRSADLQSAVSQVCNLRIVRNPKSPGSDRRLTDYKSALRQFKNLRYAKQIPLLGRGWPFLAQEHKPQVMAIHRAMLAVPSPRGRGSG